MFGQKNLIIIWVSGKQLVISGDKTGVFETIPFPENIVSNLEVVDADGLYALIKTWAVKHPGKDKEIVWIFGHDLYYEHVMQDGEKEQWDTVVVHFLDLLPFEEVESRVYTTTAGTKVVAINKDFYSALRRGFALQGYTTRAEIVASELGSLAQSTTLTSQVASYVAKNLDTIEKNRLVSDEVKPDVLNLEAPVPKKKSSLPLLLGVFGVLLAVLGYMLLTMNK